jgi:hypothetical protein
MNNIEDEVAKYIESIDEIDRIALNVAISTLGTLFSVEKSNAFIEWKAKQESQQTILEN